MKKIMKKEWRKSKGHMGYHQMNQYVITECKKKMEKGTERLFKEIMKELSQRNKGHIY